MDMLSCPIEMQDGQECLGEGPPSYTENEPGPYVSSQILFYFVQLF